MALRKQLLRIEMEMPGGLVVLNESLMITVRIKKAALAIQNRAYIDVGGLTQKMREQLLSNFTAFNKRLRETGRLEEKYINLTIKAGFLIDGQEILSVIFKGQVVSTEPVSGPPNMITRITAYTRQIDRTKFLTTQAPHETTFKNYVLWAADQMGFGNNVICETSIDNRIIYNPGRTAFVAAALLLDIQNLYRDEVAAYVDDDVLIVRDKDKILNPDNIANINEFITPPVWTEWGATVQMLFNPNVRLAQGLRVNSIINPSLNGTTFVIMELNYELASRGDQFYVTAEVSPAGGNQ